MISKIFPTLTGTVASDSTFRTGFRRWSFWVESFLVFWMAGEAAWAAERGQFVRVTGSLHCTSLKDQQALTPADAIPFECVIGKSSWSYSIRSSLNATAHIYCDGERVLSWQEREALPKPHANYGLIVVDIPAAEANEQPRVSLNPGLHPLGITGENLVWLAFCSPGYLDQPGRVIPQPIGSIKHDRRALAHRDVTQRFEDALGLPRTIELLESQELYLHSAGDRRLFSQRRPEGWIQEGWKALTYRVTESRLFQGWTIPGRVALNYQASPAAGVAMDPIVATGQVDRIEMADQPRSPLGQKSVTLVDFRFRSEPRAVDSISYPWSNSQIPSVDDPQLRAVFETIVSQAPLRSELITRR